MSTGWRLPFQQDALPTISPIAPGGIRVVFGEHGHYNCMSLVPHTPCRLSLTVLGVKEVSNVPVAVLDKHILREGGAHTGDNMQMIGVQAWSSGLHEGCERGQADCMRGASMVKWAA
jgi:hypothetical protein